MPVIIYRKLKITVKTEQQGREMDHVLRGEARNVTAVCTTQTMDELIEF